jgi:hypothetical protein
MTISKSNTLPGKKIQPFRKFEYSDRLFKPGLEILIGTTFGALTRTEYRGSKKVRVEGTQDLDIRDISYVK